MVNRVIILCSHGRLCDEVLMSAKMIGAPSNNVYTFPLMPGVTPEEYAEDIEKILSIHVNDEVVCLTDLFGGTPCMSLISLSQKYHLLLITGLNLPMLLTLLEEEGTSIDELASELIKAGKDGVINVTKKLEDEKIYG